MNTGAEGHSGQRVWAGSVGLCVRSSVFGLFAAHHVELTSGVLLSGLSFSAGMTCSHDMVD